MLLCKAFCVVVVVLVAGVGGAPSHEKSTSSLSQVFNVQTQNLNQYMPGSINRDEKTSIGKKQNDRIDQIYSMSHRIESFQKNNISHTLGILIQSISQRERSLSNMDGKVTDVLNYLDHFNNTRPESQMQELAMIRGTLLKKLVNLQEDANNKSESFAEELSKIRGMLDHFNNTRPESQMQELAMTMGTLLKNLVNLQEDANNKSESFAEELSKIRGMLQGPEGKLDLLERKPKDCEEINQLGFNKSDVYLIQPKGAERSYAVFCEMTPDRAWTVIFRRTDGSVNFDRVHADYVKGFGVASGNYWLGLEAMNLLTTQFAYKLRVDITRWRSSTNLYAAYSSFKISNSSSDYMLTLSGEHGTAPKGKLIYHNGQRFSAKDKDVDGNSGGACVSSEGGAWWHGNCAYTVLTERYTGTCSSSRTRCMRWDYGAPLSRAVMKISRG